MAVDDDGGDIGADGTDGGGSLAPERRGKMRVSEDRPIRAHPLNPKTDPMDIYIYMEGETKPNPTHKPETKN